MSIEAALAALTAAVEANTAAILGAAKAAPEATADTEKTTKTTKGTKATKAEKEEPAKPEHSREEMIAILAKVKEEKDVAAARAIIKTTGGVDKMADIPEAKIDAVFAACEAALAEEESM